MLRGHESPLFSAVFSPSDDRVLTRSSDNTAGLWLVRDEDVLKLADERIGLEEFSAEEREMYAELLGDRSESRR